MSKPSRPKYLLPGLILLVGVGVVMYGILVVGKTDNTPQIKATYDCTRSTLEWRSTDVYCSDPSKAPEYKAAYGFKNSFVYAGVTLCILGIVDGLVIMNRRVPIQ